MFFVFWLACLTFAVARRTPRATTCLFLQSPADKPPWCESLWSMAHLVVLRIGRIRLSEERLAQSLLFEASSAFYYYHFYVYDCVMIISMSIVHGVFYQYLYVYPKHPTRRESAPWGSEAEGSASEVLGRRGVCNPRHPMGEMSMYATLVDQCAPLRPCPTRWPCKGHCKRTLRPRLENQRMGPPTSAHNTNHKPNNKRIIIVTCVTATKSHLVFPSLSTFIIVNWGPNQPSK